MIFSHLLRSLLFFAVVVGAIVLSLLYYYGLGQNVVYQKPQVQKIAELSDPVKDKEYEKNVRDILIMRDLGTSAQDLKEKFLEMTVPSYRYKDIHLELVIIFDKLSRAEKEKDPSEKQELLKHLYELGEKYPWIRDNEK